MSAADNKRKLEQMLVHIAKSNKDRVQTSFTASELKQMGCIKFAGKWIHRVRIGDSYETFEIVPRSGK